jgi:hypothetical protein
MHTTLTDGMWPEVFLDTAKNKCSKFECSKSTFSTINFYLLLTPQILDLSLTVCVKGIRLLCELL